MSAGADDGMFAAIRGAEAAIMRALLRVNALAAPAWELVGPAFKPVEARSDAIPAMVRVRIGAVGFDLLLWSLPGKVARSACLKLQRDGILGEEGLP